MSNQNEEPKNYTPLPASQLNNLVQPDKTGQLDEIGKETLIALLGSKTVTEAAEKLSIARSTIYERIEKYGLRTFLEKIPDQALDALRLASVKAADVLIGELSNSRNKVQAATEILDRVGLSGKKESMGISVKDGEKEVRFIVTRGY